MAARSRTHEQARKSGRSLAPRRAILKQTRAVGAGRAAGRLHRAEPGAPRWTSPARRRQDPAGLIGEVDYFSGPAPLKAAAHGFVCLVSRTGARRTRTQVVRRWPTLGVPQSQRFPGRGRAVAARHLFSPSRLLSGPSVSATSCFSRLSSGHGRAAESHLRGDAAVRLRQRLATLPANPQWAPPGSGSDGSTSPTSPPHSSSILPGRGTRDPHGSAVRVNDNENPVLPLGRRAVQRQEGGGGGERRD